MDAVDLTSPNINVVPIRDIRIANNVPSNDYLGRFIFDLDDDGTAISMHGYAVNEVCPDKQGGYEESDWLKGFWARNVTKVGVVAIVSKAQDWELPKELLEGEEVRDDKNSYVGISFGAAYMAPEGTKWYTRDDLCNLIPNWAQSNAPNLGTVYKGSSDYIMAIQHPLVDLTPKEYFLVKTAPAG